MACLRLGSKAESFRRDGLSWNCTSGLPSDVTIEIEEMSFHLHKFPLLSRSGLLERRIDESTSSGAPACVLQLSELPGGAKSFELVAKFCYGVKLELSSMNVVCLRCAAEFLEMTEEYGEGNLIAQTEVFLAEVLGNWTDTIRALETCEEVLKFAEELHIVSRCINSLATTACANSKLFNWPVSGLAETGRAAAGAVLWNGICTSTDTKPTTDDWWYEDVSFLAFAMFKRFIQAVEAGGMKPENIVGALVFYAKRYIPQMNRQSSFKNLNSGSTISIPSEADRRALLEDIAESLPNQRGVVHTRFLLRLLHTAIALQASPSCRENLERRVGVQLDQAALEDLLVPNMGSSVESLYDIDCFQRILEHFMSMDQTSAAASPCIVEEGQLVEGVNSLTAITMVANLVDTYLADVASDVNLKFQKFQSLAAAIPDYARPVSDGVYRAIDIYLKAHPWLTDSEREQTCRLMNCQKLSLEASTHAAQNERLPLRVIMQVLFFEQLRLRTSISSWFFVSDNLDSSRIPDSALDLSNHNGGRQRGVSHSKGSSLDDVREHVSELEKECESMKERFQKLVKTKRSWNIFCRRKSHQCNNMISKHSNTKPQPQFATGHGQHKMDGTGKLL